MHRSHREKGMPKAARAHRELSWVDQGLQLFFKEFWHCRECGQFVSPFEKVCPRCGVSSPVVVSVKPFVLPIGICVAALIVVILVL
jgi:uncharacterized OB-fold protein